MNKTVSGILGLSILQILIFGALSAAQADVPLTLEDCKKCHVLEYRQINSRGMAHKEKVTCLECHEGHRPQVTNNIPECSDCHDNAPHEAMVDCTNCHRLKEKCTDCHQVHQPLASTKGEIALLHCKVCHPGVDEFLKASTSKHQNLSCAFCHVEHRDIKACDDCHGRPHPEGTHKMFKCNICHGTAHDLNKSPET